VLLQNPFLWDISDLWSNTVYPKDLNLKLKYLLSLHSMYRRVCWLQLSYLDISTAVLLQFVKLRYPLSLNSMHRRVCWLQLSYLDISTAVLLHFVTDTHTSLLF